MRARPRHPATAVGALVAVLAVLVSWAGAVSPTGSIAGAQQRRVVLVGDSIILGAQGPLTGAFQANGWAVTFDAGVSRSTLAGVEALESHRAELTDSVVLSLGANDSGNPGAFRQRVERVLAATSGVPNVYWLTIREVRDYYVTANQIVRDAAASFPNVTVIDWHGATAGATNLTAGDGLHLNGAGATALTDIVTNAVVHGVAPPLQPQPVAPDPLPLPPPPPPPPLPVEPVAEQPPVTTAHAPLPSADGPGDPTFRASSTGVGSESVDAPVGSGAAALSADERVAGQGATDDRAGSDPARPDAPEGTSTIDHANPLRWTLGVGLLAMIALLVVAGALLAAWALVGTRERAEDPDPVRRSENHPAVRARRRAERIAAAREEALVGGVAPDTQES